MWAIVWDQNKVIDIGEWSVYGGGRLERFNCIIIIIIIIITTIIIIIIIIINPFPTRVLREP